LQLRRQDQAGARNDFPVVRWHSGGAWSGRRAISAGERVSPYQAKPAVQERKNLALWQCRSRPLLDSHHRAKSVGPTRVCAIQSGQRQMRGRRGDRGSDARARQIGRSRRQSRGNSYFVRWG